MKTWKLMFVFMFSLTYIMFSLWAMNTASTQHVPGIFRMMSLMVAMTVMVGIIGIIGEWVDEKYPR